MVGRSHTLSVIYDMHDPSVERGESSSQRQAQGAFFTPSSFSSLCWLPTTTPSSSRCAKRGACRSALPRPPIRISSVFVPQILRDAPLGSRAKRRTAASSHIGQEERTENRIWRTVRPPHSEHAAAAPGSQCSVGQPPSPIWIQPPTEAHPPPHLPRPDLEQMVRGGAPGALAAQWARPCARGADLRHRSASQHLAFWPLDGPEGLLERLRSATARPGRLWYASAWLRAVLGMADPCSFCASGYCPAQRPPPRAKRAHACLARLKVRARLPRCPLTPLTPPRTRTARPKRKHRGPHTRGALGAALALHARRAPVGRCELKAGGRAAARPLEAPAAAATAAHGQPSVPWAAGRPPMGRRAPPRLARAARYTVCD